MAHLVFCVLPSSRFFLHRRPPNDQYPCTVAESQAPLNQTLIQQLVLEITNTPSANMSSRAGVLEAFLLMRGLLVTRAVG